MTADLDGAAAAVARLQAPYYLVTGAWPLFSMRLFELVTGRKQDRWLVRTIALLLFVTGGVIESAYRSGRVTPEVQALGGGTAASLAAVDLYYGLTRRISPIYVLESLVELGFVGAWLRRGRRHAVAFRSA